MHLIHIQRTDRIRSILLSIYSIRVFAPQTIIEHTGFITKVRIPLTRISKDIEQLITVIKVNFIMRIHYYIWLGGLCKSLVLVNIAS